MPLHIIRQDITKMRVDAIVNTTNSEMIGYSGVDLAVHTLAGAGLDEECRRLAPLGLGQAKITGGYNLPAKYVIHTSGPRWRGGLLGESAILKSCYIESLKLAVGTGCESVAFPLISSGVYGYPKDQVLSFAVSVITEFLLHNEIEVYLCVFDKDSYSFSKKLFDDIKSFVDDDYIDEHDEDYYLDKYLPCCSSEDRGAPPIFRTIGAVKPSVKKASANADSAREKALIDYIKSTDKSFAEKLFDLINESGMSDVECYKRANVDKRTFSKIKSNPKTYRPKKQTAVAFAIALKLDLDKTQELLASAGLTLSRSFTFDKIIRYFIHRGEYDIFVINEALFEFDQVLLGSVGQ